MRHSDVIIIGGGAAGFFTAINVAKKYPHLKVTILERGKEVLAKVKVSGGGRCNVTHAEFIPQDLVLNYPRGEKELLGPFHKFMTGDTMSWFEERGIALKIEDDGRIFPVSNSSQTIIDCFLDEAEKYNVIILRNQSVSQIEKENAQWRLITKTSVFSCDKLIMAAGSNPKIWKLLEAFNHTIVKPVPSLFTFNIKDKRIASIPGVVVQDVTVNVVSSGLSSNGPLLITHWGLSAPAILKLSAFGALEFSKCDYKFQISINFINISFEECVKQLKAIKNETSKKTVYKFPCFDLPKRLWHRLVLAAKISQDTRWADINRQQLEALSSQLTKAIFNVDGKSTFKEEFVTAGGVHLKEVNFKTFESRLHENLYFAGEILNIDAVTGGFNFQNAWTSGFIVAENLG